MSSILSAIIKANFSQKIDIIAAVRPQTIGCGERLQEMDIATQYQLTEADIDRVVQMAWEDRTPFEAIEAQFGLPESVVIRLMRQEMTLRNWQKWRARVQGRSTKHRALRPESVERFKCSRQRPISRNHISKR